MTSFAFNNTRREQFLATVLENRKRAADQPNYRLVVKADGENEAYVYTKSHGITPGEIARISDLSQFRVDVHVEDDRILREWFVDANLDAANHVLNTFVNGTLLCWTPLNRDSNGNEIAA